MKPTILTLALLAILVACTPATLPSETCSSPFAYGHPVGPSTHTQFLCRKAYALLHDNQRKVPLYSAEHLEAQNLDGAVSRTDDFRPDPDLLAGERSELGDYRNSGFDRGHMAPAGDFTSDAGQMSESFLLSNIVPQNPTMNEGIWAGLESATRACAKTVGDVYVITGPIFVGTPDTIGSNQVTIPSSIYKIILDQKTGNSRAFVIPNQAVPKQSGFASWQVSIDAVEQKTGINFFPSGNLNQGDLGSLCKNTFGT